MTSRTYDTILSVASASAFRTGNNIIGSTSLTTGIIAAVDTVNKKIKVKLTNPQQEFLSGETVSSNIITVTGTANGALNTTSLPFQANTMSGNVTTASSTISAITPSTFIAEKNAFTQNPIVRLYSIYYPGEWYPPNANGNPTGQGAGYAWPNDFPIRIAEIIGDKAEDISYNVTYAGTSYAPYPVNLSGLEQASDGKINELSLTVFNSDNIISNLVENPYLAGINTSNSVYAIVNGELVYGIDPRTVPTSASYPGGSAEVIAALTAARASGLVYSDSVVGYYGKANAMFDKTMTTAVGGVWKQQKMDTRDLLGGAVEVRTTFANFLDFWPEYSLASTATGNNLAVITNLPYRPGDKVRIASNSYAVANVVSINSDDTIQISNPIVPYLSITVDTTAHGLFIRPTGTKAYVIGNSNDRVYEYDLATPWDISSGTYLQNVSIVAEENTATAVSFSSAGDRMYIAGTAKDNIYSYTLSTPWNVTTASLTHTFNVAPYEATVGGIAFDYTGTNAYIVGTTTDRVHQFNLATAWNMATASYKQNVSITLQEGSASDIYFRGDGYRFYLTGITSDRIYQYDMSTAWNVQTATTTGNAYINSLDANPSMLFFSDLGEKVYIGGYTTDKVYQIPLGNPWDVNTLSFSLPDNTPLYIINPLADTSSYLLDNYKIDQLESLSEQVATFGLASWLQYFKIVTPKRKYYKNTCQWTYKGEECQYPGYGNKAIPGTVPTKYSPSYPIGVDNNTTTSLQPSLINTSNWTVGVGSVGGYATHGDGNSRLVDTSPYGERDIVWDISNQDTASNEDGGWTQPYNIAVAPDTMYRYSVWVRRKTIGNGTTSFGPDNTGTTNILKRSTAGSDTNPYFVGLSWWGAAESWYLMVGHIWPYGSGSGANFVDTGIYDKDGTKLSAIVTDFIWSSASTLYTGLRAQLNNSTLTATNQQFYDPRIEKLTGSQPSIRDMISLSSSQLTGRADQDICAKSLVACTARNNEIHFGGFPGVGRTVPQM